MSLCPTNSPANGMKPNSPNKIVLEVKGIGHVPSFKNRKHSGIKRNGQRCVYIETKIKERMERLEAAILFGLYSASRTTSNETDSECLKRLQTALSGLSDDSLVEIPEFSFGVRYVEPGCEGVEIEIERIL